MQYTDHYNFNLPEGTDIVNPLVQDNPNYTAIDNVLYANKLRVIGNATELTTGTVHALTRADQDIPVFKFVATSDYSAGDTFTVDGVSVTARIANASSIPTGAYKINSMVLCVLDGTILNLINITGDNSAASVAYNNSTSGLTATNVQGALDEILSGAVEDLFPPSGAYYGKISRRAKTVNTDISVLFNDTANGYTDIGLNLPSGYRPLYNIYTFGIDVLSGSPVLVLVNTSGQIMPFEGATSNQKNLLLHLSFSI